MQCPPKSHSRPQIAYYLTLYIGINLDLKWACFSITWLFILIIKKSRTCCSHAYISISASWSTGLYMLCVRFYTIYMQFYVCHLEAYKSTLVSKFQELCNWKFASYTDGHVDFCTFNVICVRSNNFRECALLGAGNYKCKKNTFKLSFIKHRDMQKNISCLLAWLASNA